MNATVKSRRAVYRFLYHRRVEAPRTYSEREELHPVAAPGQLGAALSFGLEMGHLERYRKHYYRLTAPGMLFAEQQGWMEEE